MNDAESRYVHGISQAPSDTTSGAQAARQYYRQAQGKYSIYGIYGFQRISAIG